jgi:choline-sulfatase/uncharacterized sulfatase
VSHVDHSVGELLDWLDAQGLREETIVVYSSDHGDYACEHGIMEKAPGICSDAITRVPMIWRWPGRFAAGHVATEIVEAVDFANTVCRLAELDPLETADGGDLTHLLHGGSGALRRIGVTEFAWSKSVRQGNYRLVWYPREMFGDEYPDGFGELYDLEQDPWEMHNLYFEGAYADVVRQLEGELLNWIVRTTRPTTILPAVDHESAQSELHYRNAVNADRKVHPSWIPQARTQNYI